MLTKTRTRRVIFAIVVAFLIYSVVMAPATSADYVRSLIVFLSDAIQSIFAFFDAILRG